MYTPHSILEIFKNAFNVSTEKRVISIRGVFEDRNGREYSGFYYDRIKDESSDFSMTLKVPHAYKGQLIDGKAIEFEGFISKSIRKEGNIVVDATITRLLQQRESEFSEEDIKRLEIQRMKAEKGIINCDELIKAKIYADIPMNITFLTGNGAITDRDVLEMFKSNREFYRLSMVRTNLGSVTDIIATISSPKIQNSDMLCLFRGGGKGLEIFNDVKLGQYLLSSRPALVSAIGHEKDVTLVEQIADKKCITPSALGTYFTEIYEKVIREREDSEAILTKQLTEKFKLQHQKTEESYKKTMEESKKNYEAMVKQLRETHEKGVKQLQETQMKALKDRDEYIVKLNENNEKTIHRIEENQRKVASEYESKMDELRKNNEKISAEVRKKESRLLVAIVIALLIGLIIGSILGR